MKFENIAVYNIENAIRGMRNPLNSHGNSDSYCHEFAPGSTIPDDPRYRYSKERLEIGPNDYSLAMRLINGGEPHRKFLRQMMVSVDICKMPIFLLVEFQTYKIGTTLDSGSTMHTITSRDLTMDDFVQPTTAAETNEIEKTILVLNDMRHRYLKAKESGDKEMAEAYFLSIKHTLPSSYCYERMTWTANYEVLTNVYKWRSTHRLPQWREFCNDFILQVPYSEFITGKFN